MSNIASRSENNIIVFPFEERLRRPPAPSEECGTILLFTGVRYCRWSEDDTDPVGRPGHSGVRPSRADKATRKKHWS